MELALKVILSFIVGGSYVSGIIWFSEKLGTRIGAALAGVPNTIFVSLCFISITENSHTTKAATVIIPLVLVAALIYTWVFVKISGLIKENYPFIIGITILAWLLSTALLRQLFSKSNFLYIIFISLAGIIFFHYSFQRYEVIKPKKRVLPSSIYFARFFIAGGVVAGAVLSAHFFGPLWGGIMSGFPASVLTSLYFLNKSQGYEFAKGFAKRLPLSVVSSLIFVVILHSTLTKIPTIACFVIAMLVSITYTYALLSVENIRA